MTHPRIRRCVVFPLCRTFGKAARNGQDRSLQTIRKAAIILSGFSPAMTRNIPGCRAVLSPTACGRSPLAEGAKRGAFFRLSAATDFFSFALSKTVIYGILFFYKYTGKPGANRRRKAIGAHRVSQLPTSNCCFYCRPQLRVLFGAGVDEGENTAIHRRHKAGHV